MTDDPSLSETEALLSARYTDEQIADYKKLYDSRQKTLRIVVGVLILPEIAVYAYLRFTDRSPMEFFGISLTTMFIVSGLVLAVAYAVAIYVSRCPACNKLLGRRSGSTRCSKCGLDMS